MRRAAPTRTKAKAPRHNPLAHDIAEANSTLARSKPNTGRKGKEREERRNAKTSSQPLVDASLLAQAREQQEEEEYIAEPKSLPKFADSDSEEFSDEGMSDFEETEDYVIDEADQQALEMFLNPVPARKTIADLIMEKIRQNEQQTTEKPQNETSASKLHPKVVEVYKGVGKVMHHYTSGKVPKAFKIIPSLNNWEEITHLTAPQDWSLPAYYVATRLFASNLNEKMAQRFYNTILLPRVMDDLAENKRLNYHLFRALRKAVFKPSAFYKGIVLPLCEHGCTLKEAFIISSALAKQSLPVYQSSAALYKIAQLPYNATANIFMKTLINKKYALPYKVIDQLVDYFQAFLAEKRKVPLLWHQTVLVLVQRYKEDFTREQKEAIKRVIKVHSHPQISLEIHRELDHSSCRGEVLNEEETTSLMLE